MGPAWDSNWDDDDEDVVGIVIDGYNVKVVIPEQRNAFLNEQSVINFDSYIPSDLKFISKGRYAFLPVYCGNSLVNYFMSKYSVKYSGKNLLLSYNDVLFQGDHPTIWFQLNENIYALFYTKKTPRGFENFAAIVFEDNKNLEKMVRETVIELVKNLQTYLIEESIKTKNINKNVMNRIFLEEGMKEEILTDIQTFIDSRTIYVQELQLPWKRGYLFSGPPGVGKTLLLRSLAKYFGLKIYDMQEFIDSRGQLNLPRQSKLYFEAVFDPLQHARLQSGLSIPTIYYFEDLEKIVGTGDSSDVTVLPLSSLLTALDGVDELEGGSVVIATTNNLDTLAESVVGRPGRFDRTFQFNLPSKDSISKFLNLHSLTILKKEKDVTSSYVDMLDGFSMAFVQEFIKSCKTTAKSTKISDDIAKKMYNNIVEHKKIRNNYQKIGFSA